MLSDRNPSACNFEEHFSMGLDHLGSRNLSENNIMRDNNKMLPLPNGLGEAKLFDSGYKHNNGIRGNAG